MNRKIYIKGWTCYEKLTGELHEINVYLSNDSYEVRVDGEFYGTYDSKFHAFEEVEDIAKLYKWSAFCPV